MTGTTMTMKTTAAGAPGGIAWAGRQVLLEGLREGVLHLQDAESALTLCHACDSPARCLRSESGCANTDLLRELGRI